MEILNNFAYLNELLDAIILKKAWNIYELNLTGPRKTGKSNSVEQFILKSVFAGKSVKAIVLRKEATQAVETFNEYLDVYNELTGYFSAYINHSQKLIKIWNKNEIRVISINRNRKSNTPRSDIGVGIRNAKCDYLILHFEEAHQFKLDEIRAIEEAVRGYKYMISIRTTNPWAITNEYIGYCNLNMKYDADILTDDYAGEQFKQIDKKVFHYSRYENNPYLTLQEINGLEELKTIDPLRARVSAYGLPGITDGGIYTQYIPKIKEIDKLREKPEYFTGGVDWGETKSDTTAQLWGIGYNYSWVAGYDNYEWSNKNSFFNKTTEQMAREIVDFYINQLKRFPQLYRGLSVYVDYSAFGTIDLLQLIAREKNATWLQFEPSIKHPISTRIDIITALMSLNIFYLDKRKMQPLLSDMDLSVWEVIKNTGEAKRLKERDHNLDSMEYALAPFLYDLIGGYDLFLSELEKKI